MAKKKENASSAADEPVGMKLVDVGESEAPFELVYADPKTITANPENWRTHDEVQQEEFSKLYEDVGWAGVLVYNQNTNMLCDGELRLKFAIENNLAFVPVIRGWWTEEQQSKILLMFNPVGEMAGFDKRKLGDLIDRAAAERTELIASLLSRVGIGSPATLDQGSGSRPATKPNAEVVPEMELRPFESYDYIIVLCTTTSQWARLNDLLKLERVRKPKSKTVGLNRVVHAEKLLDLIEGVR